ncbi:MAG: MBL fold metallo-hydrolase [Methanocellales archaeon]|nr:MBL fold metallo-hydrolase [Methanocellales archaeon]MDD5447201.1 MBL fold metallo-hydrolase [Methanocellales archaeon]
MLLKHFFAEKIAHSSYLLGGSNSCAIVDPQRDVDLYINTARDLDLDITHIFETHLHADFISGHLDLAEITGATIYAPKEGKCKFDHESLSEGDTITLEEMKIDVLETPGHTPEHISYIVTDKSRGTDPIGIFTGDTLFVGDVGRPDLFPGRAEELASKLFDSLHNKLLKLPDFTEIYPAHGSGSLCGRTMGAKYRSTIGYERKYNSALKITNKKEFIESLTTNMPPAPDHFSRCSDINGSGPTLLRNLPPLEELSPEIFIEKIKEENTLVLDIRAYDAFGSQHVPGSYNIDIGGNFATFAGWVLPPDKNILLVTTIYDQALNAVIRLHRVGLDRIMGYLDGGMFSWAISGFKTNRVDQISSEEFHEMTLVDHKFVLVDVRSPFEYHESHIEGAINIPAPDLRTRYKELDPKVTTVLQCSTGHRSSLAASILKQHGFDNIFNLAGGMKGYNAAGYGPACKACSGLHGPRMRGEVRWYTSPRHFTPKKISPILDFSQKIRGV